MRKAINFFRSYYEVAKELNDKDRLKFYDAIMNKQFENIDIELEGMVKFAYLSQKHSIDAQIKGYFDKTNDPMFKPIKGGLVDPSVGGKKGGSVDPSVQEKEKEKEEVQDVISFSERKNKFLAWFNLQIKINLNREGKFRTLSKEAENNLKKVLELKYTNTELSIAFKNMCKNKWAVENNNVTPNHFLRIANLEKYINDNGIKSDVLFVTPEGVEITDSHVLHVYQQTGKV